TKGANSRTWRAENSSRITPKMTTRDGAVTQGCQPPAQTCVPLTHPCDLEDLVAKVASLDTTDQVKNGLLRKLDEAKKALDRGAIGVAITKLQDFRDQVAGRAGNAISQADA